MDRELYDAGFAAMLDVWEAIIVESETAARPEKWDDEYVEHAIEDVLDRMICAGPTRPSDELRERYHALYERAKPYLLEDVELPATPEDFERGAQAFRELVAMHDVKLPREYAANREAVQRMERLIESVNMMKDPVRKAVVADFGGLPVAKVRDAKLSHYVDGDGVMQVSVDVVMYPDATSVQFAVGTPAPE